MRRQPSRAALWARPLASVETVRRRIDVVDATPAARAAGVRPGMSLAEARAMCPDLLPLDRDPAADARGLEVLGRYLTRFTPSVATGWPPPEPPVPPMLLLDITGTERLLGPPAPLLRRIHHLLTRLGVPARLAAAPTPAAAWALAAMGAAPNAVIEPGDLSSALAPLPVEALRLDPRVITSLRRLGLCTLGHVLAMPRDTLPARFGPMLLDRIDRLIGTRPDPLTPLPYDPPIEAQLRFDSPIESLETLWLILRELLRRVIVHLTRRDAGARLLELSASPPPHTRLPPVMREVHLVRPSRDPARLFELLRTATERLDCGQGFTRIRLRVPTFDRLHEEQILLLDADTHADRLDLERLLERLTLRLGPSAVLRPAPVESHLPERAWRPLPATDTTPTPPAASIAPRPLALFPTPIEIRVVAEPCDDLAGRPAQFTFRNRVHRLVHVLGPERIAGEWWRNHHKTRDYYDALDHAGRRFWLFRVPPLTDADSNRWFLHGQFH